MSLPQRHRRPATIVADAIIRSPTSELSLPYKITVWASEDFIALVLVVVVLALLPVQVAEFRVTATVTGRNESFASVHSNIEVSVACPVQKSKPWNRSEERRTPTTSILKTRAI